MQQFDAGIEKFDDLAFEYPSFDKAHFVYAGQYYFYREPSLASILSARIRKFKSEKINLLCEKTIYFDHFTLTPPLLTMLSMWRIQLITKEKMESFCKGELKYGDGHDEKSGDDDIEAFFNNLQNGKACDERILSYFLPKLTNKEVKLTEENDKMLLETFSAHFRDDLNVDIDEAEMKKSESKTKFVRGCCLRETVSLIIN